MRFPKLKHLIGKNLGSLMKRLMGRPGVQIGELLFDKKAVNQGQRAFKKASRPPVLSDMFAAMTSQRRSQRGNTARGSAGDQPRIVGETPGGQGKPSIWQRAAQTFHRVVDATTGRKSEPAANRSSMQTSDAETSQPNPPSPPPFRPEIPKASSVTNPTTSSPESANPTVTGQQVSRDAASGNENHTPGGPSRRESMGTPVSSSGSSSPVGTSATAEAGSRNQGDLGKSNASRASNDEPNASNASNEQPKSDRANPRNFTIPPSVATTATPSAQEFTAESVDRANKRAESTAPDAVRSKQSRRLDHVQRAADVAGIIDPTGIVDGANALVSLRRAKNEPERRGEHLKNAAISAVSMIPLVGDLAKLFKFGRGAKGAKALPKAGAEAASIEAKSASRAGANAGGKVESARERGQGVVSRVLGGLKGKLGSTAVSRAEAILNPANKSYTSAASLGSDKPSSDQPEGTGQRRSLLGRMVHGATSFVSGIASAIAAPGSTSSQTTTGVSGFNGDATNQSRNSGTPGGGDQSGHFTRHPAPSATQSGQDKPFKPTWRNYWLSMMAGLKRTPKPQANQPKWPLPNRSPTGTTGEPIAPPVVNPGGSPSSESSSRESNSQQPPRQSWGQRVKSVAGGVVTAIAAPAVAERGTSESSAEALNRGTNFGDVMGGRKTMSDAQKEAEGDQKIAAVKQKLSEAVVKVTGNLGKLAITTIGVVKGLQMMNAATLARQRDLGYVNASITASGVQADIAKIMLDINKGRQTQGSFQKLNQAQIDFEKAMAPFSAMATNTGNRILTFFTGWATKFMDLLKGVPIISKYVESLEREAKMNDKRDMGPWMEALADRADKARKPKAKGRL